METNIQVVSGFTDDANPELFDIRSMPTQPKEKKPGQLPEEIIRKYFENGFVVVENFFDTQLLDECREAINELVDQLAQKLFKGGKVKDLYKEFGFFERLAKLEEDFPGANVILHKNGILPPAFKAVWTHNRLLNVVEQLIGPDIAGHPVWNLRTKTPQNESTTVPWHQDVGYLDNSSYKVHQPTAWIPLLDANEYNGCMEVIDKGHKTGKVGTHTGCWKNTWYVMLDEEEMKNKLEIDVENDKVLARVPYGGMLLLNNIVPHRSLPNVSKQTRWSIDLRWQNPNFPNGFYGLKDSVLMRTEDKPNMEVNWEVFEGDTKNGIQKSAYEDFDTTIQGPWMKKWEIVHMNDHVRKLDMSKDYATWHAQ